MDGGLILERITGIEYTNTVIIPKIPFDIVKDIVDLCSESETSVIYILDSEEECEPKLGQDAAKFTSGTSTLTQRGLDCPPIAEQTIAASNNSAIRDSYNDELAHLSKKERLSVTKEKWQTSLVAKRAADADTIPTRQPGDKKTTINQQFELQITSTDQRRLDEKMKEEPNHEQKPTARIQTGIGGTVSNRSIDLSESIRSQKARPRGSFKSSQNQESVNLSITASGNRSAQSNRFAATSIPSEKDSVATVSLSKTDFPVVSKKESMIESSDDESDVERLARTEESRKIINVDSDSDESKGDTLPVARFVTKTYCQLQREHQMKNSPQKQLQEMDCQIPQLRLNSVHAAKPRHRARMNLQGDSDLYALGRKGNTSSRLHQGLHKPNERLRHNMGVTRNGFKMEFGVRELLKGAQTERSAPSIEESSNAPTIPIDKKSDQCTLSDILGDQDCLILAARGVTTAQQLENRMNEPELQDIYCRFIFGLKRREIDKVVDLPSEDVESSVEIRNEQFSSSFPNAIVLNAEKVLTTRNSECKPHQLASFTSGERIQDHANGEKDLTTRNSEYQPHQMASFRSREKIQDDAESMNTLSVTERIATDRIDSLGALADIETSHCKYTPHKSDDTVSFTMCHSAQEKQSSRVSVVPQTTIMLPTGQQMEMQYSALCLRQRNIGDNSYHDRGKALSIKPSESPSKNQLHTSKRESHHVHDLPNLSEQNGRKHCVNDGPEDNHEGVLPATTFELDENPDLASIDHFPLPIEPMLNNIVRGRVKRSRSMVRYEDPDERPPLMDPVPQMSFKTFDKKTNLPREIICVFSGFDETIYEFEVFVKESNIPNSGYGAFMTFLGARVLKGECAERSNELIMARQQITAPTKEPLTAMLPVGFGASLKLMGANLHGNNNSDFWAREALPMTARHPNTKKKIAVSLVGKHLHYDSDEEEAPAIRQHMKSWQVPRVGYLGIHAVSDYVSDDSITFSSTMEGCGVIDLGRYGPNMIEDRKPLGHYELKSFLFDGEPGGWGFEVEERLLGRVQLIDVTDDATGEISEAAKEMLAVYVNEVGHNKTLVKNVHCLEKDNRVVQYYADITKPLRKGETVELLTSYRKTYEQTRVRKGYGLANFQQGVKDDSHEPSRLQRNFDERCMVSDMVKLYSALELFHACEFVVSRVLPHLSGKIDHFVQTYFKRERSEQGSLPSFRQLIARRRIHWLSFLLEDKIKLLLLSATDSNLDRSHLEALLKQAQKWCLEMKWTEIATICDPSFALVNDLWTTVNGELVEEILFPLREKLPKVLDESSWCPVSVELIRRMCAVTAKLSIETDSSISLANEYIGLAKLAADTVRESCRLSTPERAPMNLAFDFGDDGYHQIKGDELWKCVDALFEPESTMSKGIMAKAADLFVYADAVEHGSISQPIDKADLTFKIEGRVLVAKMPPPHGSNSLCTIGLPRSADCFRTGVAELDEDWYIIWQVLYVVQAFAAYYICDTDVLGSFLEIMCAQVGIDIAKATNAIENGIKIDVYTPKSQYCAPGQEILFTSKGRTKPRRQGEKLKANATGQFKKKRAPNASDDVFKSRFNKILFDEVIWKTLESIGWTIEFGNRPTDIYCFPPGVRRGCGFKNRVDFFDSRKLVLDCCRDDPKFKDLKEVKECVALYSALYDLVDSLKARKKLPKGELNIAWLKQQLAEHGDVRPVEQQGLAPPEVAAALHNDQDINSLPQE